MADATTTQATTPDDYLDALPEPRRSELRALDELIQHAAPELERQLTGKIIGYGRYHYRYPSGREGDSYIVGLASGAKAISVYVDCALDSTYLAEAARERLGKVDVGKSCIRIKRLADVNQDVLAELVRRAVDVRTKQE
jgi:hypothetical protein